MQTIFLFLLLHFGFLFLFLGNVVKHDLEDLELLNECVGGVSDVDLLNNYFFLADFVGAKVDLALFRVNQRPPLDFNLISEEYYFF